MRKFILSALATGTLIGSAALTLAPASADAGDPMITWNADNGLTFHYGNNTIEPYPGSQSCYYQIIRSRNGQMHDLFTGSSGKPQPPLTSTITTPTTLFLETGDKLTSDCLPTVLK